MFFDNQSNSYLQIASTVLTLGRRYSSVMTDTTGEVQFSTALSLHGPSSLLSKKINTCSIKEMPVYRRKLEHKWMLPNIDISCVYEALMYPMATKSICLFRIKTKATRCSL